MNRNLFPNKEGCIAANLANTPLVEQARWNMLTVTVPSNAVTPLNSLGVQFATSGTCYVDSVSW